MMLMAMAGSGSSQVPTVIPEMTGIVEIGNLWEWGALFLAGIAAFTSLVAGTKIVVFRRLLQLKSAQTDLALVSFDDTLSSCSSSDCDDISEESFSGEEDDRETEASSSVGDEWTWIDTSGLSLSEIGNGRDVVVRSWDEGEGNEEETRFVWDDSMIRFPVYPIVAAWDFENGGVDKVGLPRRFLSESPGFSLVGGGGRRRRVYAAN